jgi:hypothetical protein
MRRNNSNTNNRLRNNNVKPRLFSGNDGDIFYKRLTTSGTITSSGVGTIALATPSNSLVQSAPATEWASFAARYQQYRVKVFKVTLIPRYTENYVNGVVVVPNQLMAIADYIGVSAPTTFAQLLSDERVEIHSTASQIRKSVSWARNPNAQLWNPTNAAIPAANTMGICFASSTTTPQLPVGTVYFDYLYEFFVEFRGSQ